MKGLNRAFSNLNIKKKRKKAPIILSYLNLISFTNYNNRKYSKTPETFYHYKNMINARPWIKNREKIEKCRNLPMRFEPSYLPNYTSYRQNTCQINWKHDKNEYKTHFSFFQKNHVSSKGAHYNNNPPAKCATRNIVHKKVKIKHFRNF